VKKQITTKTRIKETRTTKTLQYLNDNLLHPIINLVPTYRWCGYLM